jgi:hypothetical protein
MVVHADVPATPRWDAAAGDELVEATERAARLLDEHWAFVLTGWAELGPWVGPARAEFNTAQAQVRDLAEQIRAELASLRTRLANIPTPGH